MIQRVTHGSVTLGEGSTSVRGAALPPGLFPERTLTFISYAVPTSATPQCHAMTQRLDTVGDPAVVVERTSACTGISAVTVRWVAVEFSAGMQVQRGRLQLTMPNVVIPAVTPDVSRAFAWVNHAGVGTAYNDNDFIRSTLDGTGALGLALGRAPSSTGYAVDWQVATVDGAQSVHFTQNMAEAQLTASIVSPLDITPSTQLFHSVAVTSGTRESSGNMVPTASYEAGGMIELRREDSDVGLSVAVTHFNWPAAMVVATGTAVLNGGVQVVDVSTNFGNAVVMGGWQQHGGRTSYNGPGASLGSVRTELEPLAGGARIRRTAGQSSTTTVQWWAWSY